MREIYLPEKHRGRLAFDPDPPRRIDWPAIDWPAIGLLMAISVASGVIGSAIAVTGFMLWEHFQ